MTPLVPSTGASVTNSSSWRRKSEAKVLQGAFVYEEFMEYIMARSLMRHWEAASLDKAAVLAGCPFYTNLEGLGRSLQQYQFG